MEQEQRWSIQVARLGGVSIRVHLFFWILAASSLYVAWDTGHSNSNQGNLFLFAGLSLLGLAVSVILHEFAHWLATRRWGGEMPSLVIGPISGMGMIWEPDQPRNQFLVHLAGPAANILIAILALATLFFVQNVGVGWLHPAHFERWTSRTLLGGVQLLFTINWLLALVNIFPSLLFDGGKGLRALLLWKWPRLGRPQAERWVAAATRIVSALLLFLIVLSWQRGWAIESYFAPLTLFALFLFFSSENHDTSRLANVSAGKGKPIQESTVEATLRQIKESRPDRPNSLQGASQHDHGDDDDDPAWGTLDSSPEANPQVTDLLSSLENYFIDEEANEERQVDEVLIRVHQEGMQSLTAEEHALLQKVSARYRERRQRLAPR